MAAGRNSHDAEFLHLFPDQLLDVAFQGDKSRLRANRPMGERHVNELFD
jgi:hypothetical protein